jgi:hypothetical protein
MSSIHCCQSEYFLYIPGLAPLVRFQLRQEHARRPQLFKQNLRARYRFGNRLMEHLAVMPDAEGLL